MKLIDLGKASKVTLGFQFFPMFEFGTPPTNRMFVL